MILCNDDRCEELHETVFDAWCCEKDQEAWSRKETFRLAGLGTSERHKEYTRKLHLYRYITSRGTCRWEASAFEMLAEVVGLSYLPAITDSLNQAMWSAVAL